MMAWEGLPDPDTLPAQTSGTVAAQPVRDRTDTPTGSRLPGRPALVTQIQTFCAMCHLTAPFLERAPCPSCGFDPWMEGPGKAHLRYDCSWVSAATWWKPWTWFSGRWVPVPASDLTARYRRAIEQMEHRLVHFGSIQLKTTLQIVELEQGIRDLRYGNTVPEPPLRDA